MGGTGLTGRHHKWAGQVSHGQESSQVGGAGLSQAGVFAGGWGSSLTGRHHRRWVGQVSQAGIIAGGSGRFHRQASSQVGGAGLTGRHHRRWLGQVSLFSANFDNPVICVTIIICIYIYIYIYNFGSPFSV